MLDGNCYCKGLVQMFFLYEVKLMYQFDYCFVIYIENGEMWDIISVEKVDLDCLLLLWYWVVEVEVEDCLIQKDKNGCVIWEWIWDWLMGFWDIVWVIDE